MNDQNNKFYPAIPIVGRIHSTFSRAFVAKRFVRAKALAVGLLAIMIFTGCKSDDLAEWTTPIPFDWKRPIPWQTAKEKREAQPIKLVAMWNETIQYQPGETPQRGFGGRIFFYGRKQESVEVEGRVVVYAFDENGREPTNSKPDRKFVFPAELLKEHMSETDTGPSYSFWLPWDAVGGEEKEISLIAKLESTNGPVITSAQTQLHLPGTQPWDQQLAGKNQNHSGSLGNRPIGASSPDASTRNFQTVSYQNLPSNGETNGGINSGDANHGAAEQTTNLSGTPRQQMKTTTIALPSQFGRARPNAVASQRAARTFDSRFQARSDARSRLQNATTTEKNSAAAASTAQPAGGFRLGRSRAVGQPIPRLKNGRSQ